MTVLAELLTAVKDIPLTVSSHPAPADGETPAAFCLLEKHAYVTGCPWTDTPDSCCPTIVAFGRRINDRGTQDLRDAIDTWWVANIERIVRTAADGHRQRRGYIAADFAVRQALPARLDVADRAAAAARLRAHTEIVDAKTARSARALVVEIRKDLPDYWEYRRDLRAKVRAAVLDALKTKPAATVATAAATAATTVTAAATTVATAAATAAATTDAATAVTDAATADAAAVADAAVAAAAATAATVTAATVTDVAAVTAAATDAAAARPSYWGIYDAVYAAVRPKLEAIDRIADAPAELVLELFERMVAVGEDA